MALQAPGWHRDDEDDDNAFTMDGHSQEAIDIHEAIRENAELFEDGILSLVILEGLRVEPQHRGKRVGARIVRAVAEHYARHGGNPSHLFLTAYPLEDGGDQDRDGPRWAERDPRGFAKAQARLMAFYEREGFQRVGDSEYMVLDLTRQLPNLESVAV